MILLGLGANLPSHAGAPAATLHAALRELARNGITPVATSSFYVSPAWPDPLDPPFVNAVTRVQADQGPAELLAVLHAVEARFGRVRSVRNAPRTLDLDLLDYNGYIQPGPPELPHPRMTDRAFVLVPLAEVAPEWRHPQLGLHAAALLARLPPEARHIETLP